MLDGAADDRGAMDSLGADTGKRVRGVRGRRMSRRLLAVALAAVFGSTGLAGCSTLETMAQSEKRPVSYGDLSGAVTSATPRVVAVTDVSRSLNGFYYRLDASLVTDSTEPLTSDELDAVVDAIWRTLPWEPNTISLTAETETPEGYESVDLTAAAESLDLGARQTTKGGGVSLTGMSSRYGEWTPPE